MIPSIGVQYGLTSRCDAIPALILLPAMPPRLGRIWGVNREPEVEALKTAQDALRWLGWFFDGKIAGHKF
jgi:hypothetical protein